MNLLTWRREVKRMVGPRRKLPAGSWPLIADVLTGDGSVERDGFVDDALQDCRVVRDSAGVALHAYRRDHRAGGRWEVGAADGEESVAEAEVGHWREEHARVAHDRHAQRAERIVERRWICPDDGGVRPCGDQAGGLHPEAHGARPRSGCRNLAIELTREGKEAARR